MTLMKGLMESLKLAALLGAIVMVIWTMPEHTNASSAADSPSTQQSAHQSAE